MFLSASQIETFGLVNEPSETSCQRKWAFIYIEGLRPPTTAKQQQGLDFHKILENYLKYGKLPDTWTHLGQAAVTAIPHLPKPFTVEVESRFAFRSNATWYNGYRDFRQPGQLIGDHKTTGDARWIKTVSELQANIQAVIYGVEEFRQFPIDTLPALWNYTVLGKNKPKTIPVRFTLERNQTADVFFGKIEPTAQQIEQLLYDSPSANEIKPNPRACDAYGGCPFRSICVLTTEERFFSDMGTLADRIKAQQAKQGVGGLTPEGGKAPQAAGAQPPAGPGGAESLNNILANLTVPSPPPTTPAADPLAALFAKPTPAAPAPAAPAPAAPAPAAPAPAALPIVLPPPRATPAAGVPAVPAPAPAPQETPTVPSVRDTTPKIQTLYIDCAPVGEECTSAFEIVAEAMTVIRNEKGSHYRLLPYGSGPGILQEVVSEILSTRKCEGIYLSSTNQAESDAMPAFLACASRVVRGLR